METTPQRQVYGAFKHVVSDMGYPEIRLHDLRHSYAVAATRSGIDVKTVQNSLGHATSAFTLDVYAHVTEQMMQKGAACMQDYITETLGMKSKEGKNKGKNPFGA